MRYPIGLKEKAINLRKRGYSLKEISNLLGIAKSTSSLWARGIILSNPAKGRLKRRGILGQYKSALIKTKKRREYLKNLRLNIRLGLRRIRKTKEIYRLLSAILFWCEGNKNDVSFVRFTNSDPEMVGCFLNLLRKAFDINESKFRALIHLHSYHNEEKQIDFWSKITRIPKKQFYKSYQKKNTGKRIKADYPGCVAISYYDAKVAKDLWAYYKEVKSLT